MKLDKKRAPLWAFLGIGAAIVGGAYWLWSKEARRKDAKLFAEAVDEFGFPRSLEDLNKFWERARRERIENAVEAAENLLLVEEMAQYIETSERLKKAYFNLYDLSCDLQVAVWVLRDALAGWARLFKMDFAWNDRLEQLVMQNVKAVREDGHSVRLELLVESASFLKPDDDLLSCSFCGKEKTEVEKLIAGPSVHICNECVSLCSDILGDSQKKENE